MEPLIIVGSGLAGYTVAREFRKYDKTTQIIMVTQDSGDFYSKPMLSNAFAQKKSAEQLVASPAQTMVEQINMTLLAHAQLQAIDTVQREVATSLGRYRYGKLVLALGADPVRLPLAGNAAERVLSVNDLRDYAQFRAKLGNAKRVVVIGAGLIGCEFANDLLAAGIVPTVVDPSPYPLSSLLPEVAATAVRKALEAAGVVWRFGTTVASVDVDTPADAEQGDGLRVRLSDGSELQADLVLSAVGLRPRTALAAAAGIAVQRGIVVDAHGRTCAEDVYALGDCAEYADGVLPYVLPIMTAARAHRVRAHAGQREDARASGFGPAGQAGRRRRLGNRGVGRLGAQAVVHRCGRPGARLRADRFAHGGAGGGGEDAGLKRAGLPPGIQAVPRA
jgi:rubredoxin-NAD+ reductase